MQTRHLIPELMDDPNLDPRLHRQALQGLRRINRWTANAKVAWRPIERLAQQLATDRLSLIDVGTGSGDVPVDLTRLARTKGLELQWTVCDISPLALSEAQKRFEAAHMDVRLLQRDMLNESLDCQADGVLCSTFMHHLDDGQAIEVLRRMTRAARRRVIVVDLIRSRINWLQVQLACRVLSRSAIVHFDGPQSVRAAFTVPEIQMLAQEAGLADVQIRTSWPCRFVLEGTPQ